MNVGVRDAVEVFDNTSSYSRRLAPGLRALGPVDQEAASPLFIPFASQSPCRRYMDNRQCVEPYGPACLLHPKTKQEN